MASLPIALLTDFGLSDPYVGQMKAVLVTLAPKSPVIDLGHQVPAFSLAQGAYHLAASLSFLPEPSVTCVVVDPGVGSQRRIVAVGIDQRLILAPDNGLVSLLDLAEAQAWDLSQALPDVQTSATFHGRDIFAPLAARLATGATPQSLGPPIPTDSLVRLPGLNASVQNDRIQTAALHVDRFGNILLTAQNADFAAFITAWNRVRVLAHCGRPVARAVRTYADLSPDELGILAGSQGWLELVLNQESAAEVLGLGPGAAVTLEQA